MGWLLLLVCRDLAPLANAAPGKKSDDAQHKAKKRKASGDEGPLRRSKRGQCGSGEKGEVDEKEEEAAEEAETNLAVPRPRATTGLQTLAAQVLRSSYPLTP